jgi:hypothetical protein
MSNPVPQRILLGFCILLLAGCATYHPNPDPNASFIQRAQIKESGKLRVSVGVPTRAEAKAYLGVDVERHKIQPIWVRVENSEDDEFVLLPLSADPDYFSPAEAAWKNHKFLRGGINRKMDFLFDDQQVPILIQPGQTVEGLVYTNWTKGLKYVEIDLRGEKSTHFVHFAIEIPGAKLDYQEVDFAKLYPLDEIREVDDAGLKAYLEALPCCALGGDRKTPADPLNIVVVAPQDSLGPPFLRRGWMVTETIRTSTVLGTIASSLFGRVYKNSPVSALYLYDRPQDVALQKARNTVDERNHLRLWLSPVPPHSQDHHDAQDRPRHRRSALLSGPGSGEFEQPGEDGLRLRRRGGEPLRASRELHRRPILHRRSARRLLPVGRLRRFRRSRLDRDLGATW